MGMTIDNLCDSCTNIGCEFQSGIVRTKCAFYMQPTVEAIKEKRRLKMHKTYCDKCGRELNGLKINDYISTVEIHNSGLSFDFCPECATAFIKTINDWMRDTKEKKC